MLYKEINKIVQILCKVIILQLYLLVQSRFYICINKIILERLFLIKIKIDNLTLNSTLTN